MNGFQRSSFLAVLTALVLSPAAHADTTGADIVGFLNAERAANGFPAGITEDTAASAACAAWSGGDHTPGHPAPPQPTSSLTWDDSSPTAIGYDRGPWTATHDPFQRDAYWLPQVLAPRLASLGASDIGGWGCLLPDAPGTGPAPAHDVTYTYPGDGTQDALTSQPLVTGNFPGGSAGGSQPPNYTPGGMLYAFFDGPDFDPAHPATTRATSATLTGPDGAPVPVEVRDGNGTANLPTEIQLIPHGPLKPYTTYTASIAADVTLPNGGPTRSFTKTWSYTTGGLENAISVMTMTAGAPDGDPSELLLDFWSAAPNVTVTATGPGTALTTTDARPMTPAGDRFVVLRLDQHGPWHVCLSSGGAGSDYRASSTCDDVVAGAAPRPAPIIPAKPQSGQSVALRVSLPKTAKARWSGRSLTVSGVRCSAACTLRVGGAVRIGATSVKLGSKTVSRKGAGAVTVKYTISKSLAARLRRAQVRKVALTIAPMGGGAGAPVHATLAVAAAK